MSLSTDRAPQLQPGTIVEPVSVVAPSIGSRRLLQSGNTIIATAAITTTSVTSASYNPQAAILAISSADLQSSLTTQLSVRRRKHLSAFCVPRAHLVCWNCPHAFRPSLIPLCRLALCSQSPPPPLKMRRSHKLCPLTQPMRLPKFLLQAPPACSCCCCCCCWQPPSCSSRLESLSVKTHDKRSER